MMSVFWERSDMVNVWLIRQYGGRQRIGVFCKVYRKMGLGKGGSMQTAGGE